MLQNQVLKSLLSCFPEKTAGDAAVPQVIPVVNTSELSLDKLTPFLKELKSGKPIEGVYMGSTLCVYVCVCVRVCLVLQWHIQSW